MSRLCQHAPMLTGAHSIIYSKNPDADRAFLKNVLGLPHVDVGEGWLIFGLPPAEVAVHPGDENDVHEFYLMCEDVEALCAKMQAAGVECAPRSNQGWGILTQVQLPGGGKLGIYQPRHARPKMMTAASKKKAAKKKKPPAKKKKAPKKKGRR